MAGAIVGAVGTFIVQKRQDSLRSKQLEKRDLQQNVHQLETRIIRLEAEMDLLNREGRGDIKAQVLLAQEERHV